MADLQQLTNEEVVARARKAFASGRTKSLAFRRQQLENMARMFEECCDEFLDAIKKDLRKCKEEAMLYEMDVLKNEVQAMLRNLEAYAAREYLPYNLVLFLDRAFIDREPLGVVTVLGPWNYPILLSCRPVIGALAAGNAVILKPSECAPHSAEILFKKFAKYLDSECYQVVLGDIERTKDLLTHKMDHIFCTGSTEVGRSVYLSAAKHLTPVTLELGGKSPCYIDDSADIYKSTKRILWGKFLNHGQTCIAPDYILCSENAKQVFIETAKEVLQEWFGKNWQSHPDVPRIINNRNFLRLKKLLDSTKGSIVYGGKMDEQDLWIEPTLIVDLDIEDILMKEEIFGPILPIVTVKNVDEAIEIINKGSKPLALYTFAKDSQINEKLTSSVSSGGCTINDVMFHTAWKGLPFGGVGDSGIGSYYGKASFDTFSHKKSVLHRGFSWMAEKVSSPRYAPYTEKKTWNFRVLSNLFHHFNISFAFIFAVIGALIVYENTGGWLATMAAIVVAYLCSKDTMAAIVLIAHLISQYSLSLVFYIIIGITCYLFLGFMG